MTEDFKREADIGPKVKALKDLLGLTACQLSERTGGLVNRQVIADVTCGRRPDPRLSQALALAEALGTRLEYLTDPETEPLAIWLSQRLSRATLIRASQITGTGPARSRAPRRRRLPRRDVERLRVASDPTSRAAVLLKTTAGRTQAC